MGRRRARLGEGDRPRETRADRRAIPADLGATRADLGGPAWQEALRQRANAGDADPKSAPRFGAPRTGARHDAPGEDAPGDGAVRGDAPGEDARQDGAARRRRPPARHRAKPGHRAKPRRNLWRELAILVVIAVALTLAVKTYVVQAFYIPSGSMQNTLAIGDRVLINKLVYHVRGIARGDIVVFGGSGSWDPASPPPSNPFARFADAVEGIVGINHGSDVYIKRVIGLPGDRVGCCDSRGRVTVNGVPLTEQSYLYPGNAPSTPFRTVTVPPGSLWVMGDHRAVSYDSRGHVGDPGGGAIPQSAVIGRAFVIIYPMSRWSFLNIPATFDQPRLTTGGGLPCVTRLARWLAVARLAGWTHWPRRCSRRGG